MHVVLPELDGRILQARWPSKDRSRSQDGLCFSALASVPEADRIAMLADRIAALVRLQSTPRAERRVAVLLPDYPGASGRSGYAVGPRRSGQRDRIAGRSRRRRVTTLPTRRQAADAARPARRRIDDAALPLARYRDLAAALPADAIPRMHDAWGRPEDDADVRDGAFRFRARAFGNVLVAFPPDRGRSSDRRVGLPRCDLAAAARAARLRALASARRQGRCARPHGRAWHARMAARQGRGADRLLLPRSWSSALCR